MDLSKKLSKEKIEEKLTALEKRLQTEEYDFIFEEVMEDIQQYPNCELLILMYTQLLDGWRTMGQVSNPEVYDEKINKLYKQLLESENPEYRQSAIIPLFYNCMDKDDYKLAQQYLDMLPEPGIDKREMQAYLFTKAEKTEEAYPLFEQKVYEGYLDTFQGLQGLHHLALKENDFEKAEWIVGKMQDLAKLLEMSDYMQFSPMFELAIIKKDEELCLDTLEKMGNSLSDVMSFTESRLYEHMGLSSNNTTAVFATNISAEMNEDDETFGFIKDKERLKAITKLFEEKARGNADE